MFLDNKYSNVYYIIIRNAQNQQRSKKDGIYYEKHHIIPKALGGNNNTSNLVLLTSKEHYICHRLLVKFTSNEFKQKMSYALWGMINKQNKFQRRFITSRSYSQIKKDMQESLSKARKGKTLEELWGIAKATSIRNNLKNRKTRGSPSLAERESISKRVKLKSKQEPWKRNFEINRLPIKTCVHCNKSMDAGNFQRYHDNNCKLKPIQHTNVSVN